MLIIGLGHKARHGKDTVAQTIIEKRGTSAKIVGQRYDIRAYSFAKALKDEVNEAAYTNIPFGSHNVQDGMRFLCDWASRTPVRNPDTGAQTFSEVPFDENPDMSDPLCPFGKQSKLLQWWGTEYRRWQDPHYWVRTLERTILDDAPEVALITDVRFPNEFWWVKDKMNGELVKVERLGYVVTDRDPNHYSETALSGYEFDHQIIVPDGQLEELKRDAVELFDLMVAGCTPGPTEDELRHMVEEVDASESGSQEAV